MRATAQIHLNDATTDMRLVWGVFDGDDGWVLQGPPSRPLPRIVLEKRGDELVVVDIRAS